MAEETVRGLIEALTEAAAGTLNGLDSPVDLGICDGKDLQYIDEIDVSNWTLVNRESGTPAPGSGRVLIRGHWHPDKAPGELRHGLASDVDEELRELTEGDQGSTP
jgi:hypothetical protein